MSYRKRLFLIGWMLSLVSTTALATALPANYKNLNAQLAVSGYVQSPAQLEALKADGVQVIISLLPDGEQVDFDESAAVQQVGIAYVSIPIATAVDLTEANVLALDQALSAHAGKKVLVHCASGNRVGALLALRANWLQGMPEDAALALGQDASMTRLAEPVRALLR